MSKNYSLDINKLITSYQKYSPKCGIMNVCKMKLHPEREEIHETRMHKYMCNRRVEVGFAEDLDKCILT